MPDHASLGLPADPRACHGARRWNGRSAVAQRRTADGQTGRLAGGDHAGSARRCAPAARGAATRARALPNLFPQPSRDGPLSPVGGMAGLRRLGGRRQTGGRADWQAVAIICRGGALGGRQFCYASARPHNHVVKNVRCFLSPSPLSYSKFATNEPPFLRSNKVPPDRIHSQRACER